MAVPLICLAILTGIYLAFALREQRRSPRGWSRWRVAAFLSGALVLALGLLPQYLPFSEGDFRQHMIQHLLMGMLAPLGLVMAAPITLLLRTMPAKGGRTVAGLFRSGPFHALTHPVTALVLDMGGMAALYFTPLYSAMMMHPALHYLIHFHFVAAGCLFTWAIAGPDPARRRFSVPARLVVLGIAIVIHSVLAQLLYAGVWVTVPAPLPQLQQAAELMYYGGDITEILLAFALVSTWRPAGGSVVHSADGSDHFTPSAPPRSSP